MPSKNTKKKLKQSAKSQQHKKVEEAQIVEEKVNVEAVNAETSEVKTQESVVQPAKEEPKKEEVKADSKQDKNKKKKEKKPSKMKQKGKEVFSELKKVNWPTFGQVMKKTGVVLVVVAVFAVVLLGIDKVLELLYTAFINGSK